MDKFKGTPAPWHINHWEPGQSGCSCIKNEFGIQYYSGDAVDHQYYGVRANVDPMKYHIPGSFEGAHITDIEDFRHQDGGKECKANAYVIAAAPELLEALLEVLSMTDISFKYNGKCKNLTEAEDLAKRVINKALGT